VQVGATAPQAAGVIHTDFERGFIRAEVTSFADYIAARASRREGSGKLRLEGKDYVVRDGDVMHSASTSDPRDVHQPWLRTGAVRVPRASRATDIKALGR